MLEAPGVLIETLCTGASQLFIASPYVKAEALNRVMEQLDADASLTCITRWNIDELVGGASDLECRAIVLDFGGSFQLHPSLHAKYYRIDDEVLIGSANLTASAMGWSRQPNLEILCRPREDFDGPAFQENLLDGARDVSDLEFARWEACVDAFAQGDNQAQAIPSSLGHWRPATRDPRHLELAYQGRYDQIASSDEQRAANQDLKSLAVPTGLSSDQFESWASICLLTTPFADAVLDVRHMDPVDASRIIAESYALSPTEARRGLETVLNWLVFLAPDTLEDLP